MNSARMNALYTGSLRINIYIIFLSRGIIKFISGAELKWLTVFTSSTICMMSSAVAMEIVCITNIGSISSEKTGIEKLL